MPFFRGLTPEDGGLSRLIASEFIRIARDSWENSLRTRREESIGTASDFIRVVVMAAIYAIYAITQDAKKRQTVAINIPACSKEEG